jgi:hypothetical protein
MDEGESQAGTEASSEGHATKGQKDGLRIGVNSGGCYGRPPFLCARLPTLKVAPGDRSAMIWVSRPEEFHPKPLAEPCVNLSIYTAPIIQPNIW